MARHLKRVADIGLTAVSVEGGLISPDQVAAIAATTPDQKAAADYGCPKGTNLRDEITRYFRIGQAHWQGYANLPAPNVVQTAAFVKSLLERSLSDSRGSPVPKFTIGMATPTALPWRPRAAECPSWWLAPLPDGDAFTKALPQFGDDHGGTIPRRSPIVLLQDWLNANPEVVWGLVFAGDRVRLMRDNASFTRPAFIEADLGAIFRDEMFADFTAIWLVIHATRFGGENASAGDCALERWREVGLRAGTAVRERLGQSVEEALLALGQGFLDANPDLRAKLDENRLSVQAWFEQLLRVVYRLIFLAVSEDRDLLHDPDTSAAARELYASAYGFSYLRERSARRSAHDHHHDVWAGVKIVFRGLGRGEKALGLPPLGSLFAEGQTTELDNANLSNRAFLGAVFRLSWLIEEGRRVRINWRDMATEELGSVYEGLLELVPTRLDNGRRFSFAGGEEARGNARKKSGSYYTPDSLVQVLLDRTLDPIVARAEAEGGADEILKLSVIDPACGSGHFLLGAARRMATRIALLRDSEAPDYSAAMRDVARQCVYGVDRNPMAVELAKVAMWIEAVEPGKPLTFLDSHIRCGDSLVGVFDIESLRSGIPDDAYDPLEGDDKELAKIYARRNKEQRDGKTATGFLSDLSSPTSLINASRALLSMPEDTLPDIVAKEVLFKHLHSSPNWLALKLACDAYVAAFFIPKIGIAPNATDLGVAAMPETDHVWAAARGKALHSPLVTLVDKIADDVRAFHWSLEFPAIMAGGGFDAVIGNPPWERIKLQEQEFFAARDVEIATAPNKAERDKLIKALKKAEPGTARSQLSDEFEFAKRAAEAASVFVRKTGRFPLSGVGDVNTYALFAELFSRLARASSLVPSKLSMARVKADVGGMSESRPGRAGLIVPTGIATDSSTSAFFGELVANNRLADLIGFDEIRKWFPSTDDRKSFCFLGIGDASQRTKILFEISQIAEITDERRQIELTPNDFKLFNPNTLTSPLFRGRADRDLTRKMYNATPVLIRERADQSNDEENLWGINFQSVFHMSNDSGHFRTSKQLLEEGSCRDGSDWRQVNGQRYVPLYEAKMVHLFDHRFGSYSGLDERPGDGSLPETPEALKASREYEVDPWYWVPEDEVALRLARLPSRLKQYYRKESATGCLKVLAEWVLGTLDPDDISPANLAHSVDRVSACLRDVLGSHVLDRDILGGKVTTWLGKVADGARKMQRETPLSDDDLIQIKHGRADPLELTTALIARKRPRWLMGWRDICRSTDERTVIASVIPSVGVNDKFLIMHHARGVETAVPLLAVLTSIPLDYAARQKAGGTSFKYYYIKQLPVPSPDQFGSDDIAFLTPRVLELTYTSRCMRAWAEDLGYRSAPFAFDPDRRAYLRAELDAFLARKYNLTRDELRYVLDPAETLGPDYPSETFRVLKINEERRFGEYRTRRLVLEAFDLLSGSHIGTTPTVLRPTEPAEMRLPDGAWARSAQSQPGDVGAVLAAILKAIGSSKLIREVRFAAALVLEPRLLGPLLPDRQASEWRRLVGSEADPLVGNVAAFATRNNAAWGAAVRNHRGNGRLIEDPQGDTWAPGSRLDAIDTTGWPDGRAGFVLDALGALNFGTAVSSLPDEIQNWISDAAAA